MPRFALHADRAAVRFDNATRDGQAQPCSARGAAARFLAAIEAIEDVRQIFRANPLTGDTLEYAKIQL